MANNPTNEQKRGGCRRILGVFAVLSLIVLLIGGIFSYFYWQSVKKTPQYSLALLVDAARRNDKEKVSQIVDTEQIVNNFTPQITEKAVELYGRNIPAPIINKIAQFVAPLMPAIKDRAKEELPNLIREKTENFSQIPYWMIALGAERALDIKVEGDTAYVKSKIPEKPLDLTMKKDGQLWKVVAVKDEKLSQKIAERIGQQLIALVKKGSLDNAEKQLGVENLGDLLKNLNDILK